MIKFSNLCCLHLNPLQHLCALSFLAADELYQDCSEVAESASLEPHSLFSTTLYSLILFHIILSISQITFLP